MNEYYAITYSESLSHHGILGQKWGKKNGPPYPLDASDHSAREKKAGWRRSLTKGKAKKEGIFAREERRLIEHYKKRGFSEKDAKSYAKAKVTTEKVLLAAGAIALTAAVGYGAYKYSKYAVDGKVAVGQVLQRVSKDGTTKLHDIFFASANEHDHIRYEKLYGGQIRQGVYGFNLKPKLLKLVSDGEIKVASEKNAIKVFKDTILNNKDFRDAVVNENFHSQLSDLNNKQWRELYETFNAKALMGLNQNGGAKPFYDALKSKGYGAIQDMNDMKFSGYNAKNPLIIFDAGSVKVSSIKDIDSSVWDVLAEEQKINRENNLKEMATTYSTIYGSAAMASGAAVATGMIVRGTKEKIENDNKDERKKDK